MSNQNSMSEWFNRNIVEKVCNHNKNKHLFGEVIKYMYSDKAPLVVNVNYTSLCVQINESYVLYVCLVWMANVALLICHYDVIKSFDCFLIEASNATIE